MSQEKGTPAQRGTNSKEPVVQKAHKTGEANFKIKLNGAATRLLIARDRKFLKVLAKRVEARF